MSCVLAFGALVTAALLRDRISTQARKSIRPARGTKSPEPIEFKNREDFIINRHGNQSEYVQNKEWDLLAICRNLASFPS